MKRTFCTAIGYNGTCAHTVQLHSYIIRTVHKKWQLVETAWKADDWDCLILPSSSYNILPSSSYNILTKATVQIYRNISAKLIIRSAHRFYILANQLKRLLRETWNCTIEITKILRDIAVIIPIISANAKLATAFRCFERLCPWHLTVVTVQHQLRLSVISTSCPS